MRRLKFPILLVSVLAAAYLAVAQGHAALVSTGPSKSDLQTAVEEGSKSAFEKVMGHGFIGDIIIDGITKLSGAFLKALMWVYGLIGTILIPIPDLADKGTYSGGAAEMVTAVYRIMVALGVFVALICFVSYVGPRASGLTREDLSASAIFRLVVAITLIFVWPSIFSFTSRMATDIGYLIFGQNRLETSGVLRGITDLKTDADTLKTPSAASSSSFHTFNTDNIQASMSRIWRITLAFALFLCMIGIIFAGNRISQGDQNGYRMLLGAIVGIILIVSSQYLVQSLFKEGASIGTRPLAGESTDLISGQSVVQDGGLDLPGTQAPTGSDAEIDEGAAAFVGGLLKIIISLWGIVICIGVLFAKFMQVISLLIVFFLGPIFAGLTAHPRTEQISRAGLNLMLKLQLYSIIWAVALLGLYLVEHIRFGDEILGAGNILTAFAVLAGLMIIEHSQEFAGLLASTAGGSLGSAKGEWSGFYKSATGMALVAGHTASSAKGGVQKLTGEKGQAAVGLAGAAVGAVIPGFGSIAGAAAGVRMTQAVHGMASIGSPGGSSSGGSFGNTLINRLDKLISQKGSDPTTKRKDLSTLTSLKSRMTNDHKKRGR